jgi:hypothetical protein
MYPDNQLSISRPTGQSPLAVQREAIYALCQITAESVTAVRAVLDANVLIHISELLDSPDDAVLECTCCMIGNMAKQVELTPYAQLVSLLE